MSDDRQFQQWRSRGVEQLSRGDLANAIESFKRALGLEPDDPEAHALLAICLLGSKRLHAAETEARLALLNAPDEAFGHYAMASVLAAGRRFKAAEEHFAQLLELEPLDPVNHLALARMYRLAGRNAEVLPALQRAIQLDPERPGTMAALAEYHLGCGELAEAERWARQALEIDAGHQDALIVMGSVLLQRGNLAEAREHAIWALRVDPTDEGALGLLADLKARSNWFLGLWWRWHTWMGSLGDGRSILVLLGAYVVSRVATILLEGTERAQLADLVEMFWFIIVIYTWVGPAYFERMVRKELGAIRLNEGF